MNKHSVIWCDRGWLPTYYGFCPSKFAWEREMKRLKIKDAPPYPDTDGRTTRFEKTENTVDMMGDTIIVTIADHIDKRKDVAAICALIGHEAVHVWQFIREDIGEDNPGREIEAYAIQYITLALCGAYRKTRRKL